MLKGSGAFRPRNADRSDDGFSGNEAASFSRAAIFRSVAFVDHRIALFRTRALAWILRARGRIERGATRDVARERATPDLFSHARCDGRGGGCPDRLRRRAYARQVARAVDVARLHALGCAGTSAGDLLPGHAVFGSATRHERQRRYQGDRNEEHGTWLARMHGECEVGLQARGFRRLRRRFRTLRGCLFRGAVRVSDRLRCRNLPSHFRVREPEERRGVTITEGAIIGGKFKLDRPLAQGGMGSVWVARHQLLDTDVAVKFMEKSIAENESARQRFEREAKAAALIKSPHVVQVLDYGIEEGAPYIAMELLDGEDLDHRLQRGGPLTLDKAYVILEQVGKALRRAHELGIVHRDLKPSNIFLSKHGDEELVKILDFGIAKDITATTSASATSTGALMGSPSYMSPEQIRETKLVDHRSDLWSIGVILYEVLTGRLPFDESENIGKLLVSICTDPVLPPSVLVPTLSIEVDRFFEKALSRDRTTRFQNMGELVEAFGACVGVRPTRTTLLIGDGRGSKPGDISETAKTLSLEPVAAKSVDRGSATRLDSGEMRGSLAPSESGDHGGSSRKKFVPIVIGTVVLAAVLGVGVAMRSSSGNGPKVAVPEETTKKPLVETVPSPAVSTAGTLREVSVTIDPSDATVEVDGRIVSVNPGGTVTISGELGSVHPVHVYKDKLDLRGDVIITAKGASPDKLALPAAAPTTSTMAVVATPPTNKTKDPGPVVTATQPTSTPQPTTTKTTKSSSGEQGPDRNFDP